MTPIGRREFLKLSAIAGAAAGMTASGFRFFSLSDMERAYAQTAGQDVWIPTTCNMCGGTTGRQGDHNAVPAVRRRPLQEHMR
ncbi:MAG: twin-arginine translocation signal domain-containing protein [Chloroflexi bacterium]|nr:twin-arginine translocation signal domain-containing protein [Chloroflexota bacterium]